MLEPILQQVGAGNPQLAQLITSHPDQFLSLLSEAADDEAPLPPGAQAISVTEEERDAIERVSYAETTFETLITDRCVPALSIGVRAGPCHPGILCVRQERRACRQFSLRSAGRAR